MELPEATTTGPKDAPRAVRKGDKGRRRPRRVRKARERGPVAVAAAVCPGSRPAKHIVRWLRGIEELPQYQLARKDLKRNIWRFANALARCPGFDPASMTIMPLWKRLEERFGFQERSITNYIKRLHEWGVLGTVAKGRTAKFTPKSSGRVDNEAAIYVLLEKMADEPVEKTFRPVPSRAVNNPPHARSAQEEDPQSVTASPFATSKRAATRLAVNHLLQTRTEPFWPANTPQTALTKAKRRSAERLAAAECQFRSFPLRDLSTAHVAALIRPFLRAGWTINDILTALDSRPTTDARYHHDGATGVVNMAAWIKHRLNAWVRSDGSFFRSPSQKRAAELSLRAAEQRATVERREREHGEKASFVPPAQGWRERLAEIQQSAAESASNERRAAEAVHL